MVSVHFNPRAPYGARPQPGGYVFLLELISIHAPHTGRDMCRSSVSGPSSRFQSTRPIRGATTTRPHSITSKEDFNPRAPYGARLDRIDDAFLVDLISIHAPHTGRDASGSCARASRSNFNPRAPYGARPPRRPAAKRPVLISIHAPHTGRDSMRERMMPVPSSFQSTRPIRGAT